MRLELGLYSTGACPQTRGQPYQRGLRISFSDRIRSFIKIWRPLGRSISAAAATATEMSRTSQTKALKKKEANTEPTPYDDIKVPDSLGMFMVFCELFCFPHNFGPEKL
jgi:hypothetical protein